MSEENKRRYREFVDQVISNGNMDGVDEFIAEDFVEHDPVPGMEALSGREAMKQMIGMFRAACPDLTSTTEFVIAEGDLVVGRHTERGTQTGEMMGMPATGKSFEMSEIHVVRIVDGMAVEHWGVADQMSMIQQLGVIPS